MYLLSDATTTSDILRYVSDLIKLNLSIRRKQIPRFTGGTNDQVQTIEFDNLQSTLEDIIESILNRIRDQFPDININIYRIRVDSNPITIEIEINGVRKTYDIANRNLQ